MLMWQLKTIVFYKLEVFVHGKPNVCGKEAPTLLLKSLTWANTLTYFLEESLTNQKCFSVKPEKKL
jgi:hypothetical protein